MSTPSQPSSPKRGGHLAPLDGLRGIAILLVMFHHYQIVPQGEGLQAALYNLSMFGPHGVDLFFVLSGFLITGILLDSRGHIHYFRNFYIRRTLRIFPLYYAVVFLCVVVLPRIPILQPERMSTVSVDWPWYLGYVSNFLVAKTQSWRHPILGVTWSLAIEEQFYLIWAGVVFLLVPRRLRNLSLGLIAFSAAARITLLAMGAGWMQVYVLTPCRFDAIALGAYIAATWREPDCWWQGSAARGIVRWVAYLGTLVALLLYALAIAQYDRPRTMIFGYTPIAILFGSWLCTSLSLPNTSPVNRLLGSSFLRFFGKYSYAIYLFHLPIRAVIRDTLFHSSRIGAILPNDIVKQMVFYVVATAAVAPAALLSWNVLEKPLLALKERFPS